MFDWITGVVEKTGYLGVALLMLAENIFPPIPSEMIMPLAGFTAAQGELNIILVVLAGSIGSLAGALTWYRVGAWMGSDRLKRWAAKHGRWLTLHPGGVDKTCDWFDRHGGRTVLVGRLIPTIRTLISVPAGIARMPLLPFLIFGDRNSDLDRFPGCRRLFAPGQLPLDSGLVEPAGKHRVRVDDLDLFRVAAFQPSGEAKSD